MDQSRKLTVREFASRCQVAYRRLKYIAAGVIGTIEGSEDIVQQAFTIGVEKDLEFENEAQLVGWMAGVVRRCALNQRRKVNRRKTTATDPIVLTNVESGTFESDSERNRTISLNPTQTSFDDQVIHALMQLSAESRTCLLLRTVEQLSYKEISELMEIPEGTALSLVHRSRKKLRHLLMSTHHAASFQSALQENHV
ncbi:MAG: RNA polymerase sigma factor [Planctomycetota bacterium]